MKRACILTTDRGKVKKYLQRPLTGAAQAKALVGAGTGSSGLSPER
jgi:hypothetical protein